MASVVPALILAALAGLPLGTAPMVGPVPLPFIVPSEVYVGAIMEDETHDIACTMLRCPSEPICTFPLIRFRAELNATLGPSEALELRVDRAPYTRTVVALGAEGIPATASIETVQGDSCLDVWVHGRAVEGAATYVLRLVYLPYP